MLPCLPEQLTRGESFRAQQGCAWDSGRPASLCNLCRRAFELAFATSYMFAGSRPRFRQVGEIKFKKPVEVGDLLRLRSTVVYTHEEPGTSQVSP